MHCSTAFDAVRLLVAVALLAFLDAIARLPCKDGPSHFAHHYSGSAGGGGRRPFAIDLELYEHSSERGLLLR